jgi:hypothetical protein
VAEVAPLILDLGADLLHQAWQASVQT